MTADHENIAFRLWVQIAMYLFLLDYLIHVVSKETFIYRGGFMHVPPVPKE